MVRKSLYTLLIVIALVVVGYLAGPRPSYDALDNGPIQLHLDLGSVGAYVAAKEESIPNLKPNNEAQIIWNDTIPTKTEYSIVYLHGFSASQGEGLPIHRQLANDLEANLYLSRLRDHGIEDGDAFRNIDPEDWVDDAKEAIAIGKTIGEKLIVLSCSTGGTLGIYLAANDPEIHTLILLSPNIDIYNQTSDLFTGPWGRTLANRMMGEYRTFRRDSLTAQYWSNQYHIDGLIALQSLLDRTMKEDIFGKINVPVFCGYYYKNEEEQDHVVSVEAMHWFRDHISTPADRVRFVAFPNAGDHVIGSELKSDAHTEVLLEIRDFFTRDLGIILDGGQ